MHNHCFITSLHKDELELLNTINKIKSQIRDISSKQVNYTWFIKATEQTNLSKDIVNQFPQISIFKTKYIKTLDEGIYDAWNQAILKTKADSYSFIGAGDTPNLKWTENATKLLKIYDIVFGDVIVTLKSGRIIRKKNNSKVNWEKELPHSLPVVQAGILFSGKKMNSKNLFDSTYKVVGDWEWIVRNDNLRTTYLQGYHITFPLGGMSNGPQGIKRKIQEHARIRKLYKRKINLREVRFYFEYLIFWIIKNVKGQ